MCSSKLKNRYTFSEFLRLSISFLFTKLFWRKAKLICYPISVRGKRSMQYGKKLNVGYNCRFDLLNVGKTTLIIGDNCAIGDNCHIVATEKVEIGKNFLCASKVFISDTNHGNYSGLGEVSSPDVPPSERELISNPVRIGNNVWIGENCVVLPGSIIGDGCIIGANSVVNSTIPDNCIAVGAPARVVKKYDDLNKCWSKVNK